MSPDLQAPTRKHLLSLVVPVHNESGSIEPFLARARPVLEKVTAAFGPALTFEIIFVDDGSSDGTARELRQACADDPRIRVVSLSRNFGKDTALAAGLVHASGMAVIPIDVDLQDPPELIPAMVERWVAGYDMVTARRANRSVDGWLKRRSAELFYRLFNCFSDTPITENAGDFRLLSRNVVDVLNRLPERARFMKGLFAWVGFSQCYLDYTRAERSVGASKWRYWKLWNFALDGITSFTTIPLRIWSYLGGIAAVAAFVFAVFLITRTMIWGNEVPGYASLMVVVLFLGGTNLLSIGVLGEYLGRVYTETKGRPLYVVKDKIGFEREAGAKGKAWTEPSMSEWHATKSGTGGFEPGAKSLQL
jgi:glycosyltransferase involved in cell wall biosynthesis